MVRGIKILLKDDTEGEREKEFVMRNMEHEIRASGRKILPLCEICDKVPVKGIYGGYRINRTFVCTDCLDTITYIKAGSSEYQKVLVKIKKIYRQSGGLKAFK